MWVWMSTTGEVEVDDMVPGVDWTTHVNWKVERV